MATRYVSRKTTYLYKATSTKKRHMVLIFGDEVDASVNTDPVNGRIPASFRGRDGFIDQDALMQEAVLEVYFIDVGQGDSTFIVTPGTEPGERKKILIDGGQRLKALGFLIWKYRLDQGPSVDVDLAVLSHADGDHLNGLVRVLEHNRIHVRHVVHPGIATFASGHYETPLGDRDASERFLITWHDGLESLQSHLSEEFGAWRRALADEGAEYRGVDADGELPSWWGEIFPEGELEVLGPRYDFNEQGFRWFGDAAHTINGHSVVLKLTYDQVQMLFPGDINIRGSRYVLEDAQVANRLSAHVLKAPHHGSHELHPPFLRAARPQITVVSSGDHPDHGHPRAVFLGSVAAAARSEDPLIFSTEIAASFVETGDELAPDEPSELDEVDFSTSGANATARKIFKQSLPGIINVRTDGRHIYAARRVKAGYWWEGYGPIDPRP